MGAARYLAARRIKLLGDYRRGGVSPWPEFEEVAADVAKWAGRRKYAPRLSEEKAEFLHALKRMSV
jgi:hypothetical protein